MTKNIFVHIFTWTTLLFTVSAYSAELKHTRYIGWIQLENRAERLAVVADLFLESPEDFTKFPRLNAAFRMSLGGYNTHEYLTEIFHNLKYDFDGGALTFDEEGNDLLMTTEVKSAGGRSKITGEVFVRSVAMRGTLELLEESDEPGDDVLTSLNEWATFASLLEGQYEGYCDGKPAALQIQTVRGLHKMHESKGLEREYAIGGRLVYKNDALCGKSGEGKWCARRHFQNGAFNLFTERLSFASKQGAEECQRKDTELNCRFRVLSSTVDCRLKKPGTMQAPKFFPRRFYLNPNREQRNPLPEPKPPLNQGLAHSLKGRFFGYLHNEANNTYTPLRLDVIPFSSTENPHNPNQMMVSATGAFFLGRDFTGPFMIQHFEPRSFYLRPGFMLSAPDADSSFSISTWKTGFISGTWISRAFGKVGTLQLIKGEAPPLEQNAKAFPPFTGEFTGFFGEYEQWIRFLFPVQLSNKSEVIPFTGSYQPIVGITPVHSIEAGAYDLFTGRFGWSIILEDNESLGSGRIDDNGDTLLFLPPHPTFATATRSLEFQKFRRKEEK